MNILKNIRIVHINCFQKADFKSGNVSDGSEYVKAGEHGAIVGAVTGAIGGGFEALSATWGLAATMTAMGVDGMVETWVQNTMDGVDTHWWDLVGAFGWSALTYGVMDNLARKWQAHKAAKAQYLEELDLYGRKLAEINDVPYDEWLKDTVGKGGSKAIDYVKLSDELGNKIEIDGYKIIDIEDAATANADWADMGYDLPPVAAGTKVYNVEAGNHQYARVFKEGVNKPKSPFILRADDIKGLSAAEIAEKYALPQVPDKIVYPKIPSDTPLEVSIVGPQESWGTLGGDAQYAIKDVFLDDDWFIDIHDLK